MDATRIANKARKHISNYCHEDCKAYCCRKGYLVLNKKEINLVCNKHPESFKENIKEISENKFSLNLGINDCPALTDFKCTIHKKKNRSSTCKDFPIFIIDKNILLSSRCSAIMSGMLFPFIKQWESLNYKVIHGDPARNQDQYDMKFSK